MKYEQVVIGDLCRPDRRPAPADDLPFLGLEAVESLTGAIHHEKLRRGHTGGAYHFDARHVLYARLRPALNKVAAPNFAGRCSTEFIPLLPKEGVARDYLAWLLRSPAVVSAAVQSQTGARMPRADLRRVLATRVVAPASVAEQQRAADAMADYMTRLTNLRAEYAKQLQLLDACFQQALQEFPFVVSQA